MDALPFEAQGLLARIEAMLDETLPTLRAGIADEIAFSLRETRRRYLPDTLDAYAAIPPAKRDAAAAAMLVDQLHILERATAQRVRALRDDPGRALAANGRFLRTRFADAVEDRSNTDASGGGLSTKSAVARLVEGLGLDGAVEPIAALERAAVQLEAVFPELVRVERSGLLANGPIVQLLIDVPRRDDLRRFVVRREGRRLETAVSRYVRGVRAKSTVVDVADWKRELTSDVSAYAERNPRYPA